MQQANRVVSNAQRVALLPHIPCEATVAGIVLQQMGHALGIRQLVDRHHGDFRPSSRFVQCAQYAAADAPKPFIAMRMVMLLLKRAVPAGLTHRRRAGADWLSH